ncbi:MAG: cupin domain-containing protein [Phenylobacterium sp.]|uniref:cupin domain-containing protein n=1 Tax=Phenylobacterium sp. TaxID=1871053 RepID=UPI00391BD2ED
MKKIDLSTVPVRTGSSYPAPFDVPCAARTRQGLSRRFGLTAFGVNLLVLPPGAWSSQRHWHSREDEFVWVLEGEVVLVTDAGEEVLRAGDCAAFRAGEPDGHHLVNRSDRDARVLEVGNSDPEDVCAYADIDMLADAAGYRRRDGTPYPPKGGS